jgi:hypothetical protein
MKFWAGLGRLRTRPRGRLLWTWFCVLSSIKLLYFSLTTKSVAFKQDRVLELMSRAQDSAVDRHSMDRALVLTVWPKYTNPVKNRFLSLHDLSSTGSHLLIVSFITSMKSTLCTALNTQNTTEDCYFILHVPRPLHFSEVELLAPESLTVLRHASILCITTRITRKNRVFF